MSSYKIVKTDKPSQLGTSVFKIKLSNPELVFLPKGFTKGDEAEYRLSIEVNAMSKDHAEQQITMMLLQGKYAIIHDTLWAWR